MDPNYKEADKLMILLYFNVIFRFFQSLELERIWGKMPSVLPQLIPTEKLVYSRGNISKYP